MLQAPHLVTVVPFALGAQTSGLVLHRTDLENPDLDVSIHILAPLSSQSTPHRLIYFILGLWVFLLGHPRALTHSYA